MGKLFLCTFLVAVFFVTTGLVANTGSRNRPESDSESSMALDGGFRDGLYVGRFMAEQRMPMRPPIGRWSTEQDRRAFLAGYRRGYSEFDAAAERQ